MKRIAIVMVVSLSANGWSGEATGAAFLKVNPSVKGESLGGLNPAAVEGAQAMGVNPGAVGLSAGYELTSGFATMIGESSYGTLAVAGRRGDGLTIGAHATYLQSGNLSGRDASGNLTSDFAARDVAAGVTAARSWGGFSAGITGKAVRQEIGEHKSNTAPAVDVGAMFNTGKIGWGASALNLGGKIEFEGKTVPLPAIYALGASVPLGGGMTGLAGISQIAGETVASVGMEYNLKGASLRVGYRSEGGENLAKAGQKSSDQALGGVTGGIGVTVRNFRLDYGVSQAAVEYGMSHRAAVTWKWGEAEKNPAGKRSAGPEKRTSIGTQTEKKRVYDAGSPPKKAPSKKKKVWVY